MIDKVLITFEVKHWRHFRESIIYSTYKRPGYIEGRKFKILVLNSKEDV